MADEEVMAGAAPTGLDWAPQMPMDYAFEAPRLTFWGKYHPYDFGNWEAESRSIEEGCYIHVGLSFGIVAATLEGPDADKLLSDYSVSDFTTMKPYRGRHTVFCTEKGTIVKDGVAVKLAENKYRTYDLAPYLTYIAQTSGYDVDVQDVTEKMFLFQLGGPTSLQTLEAAAQMDLHDLAFMRLRDISIAGHDVQVLRMGMCGTLGYEIHGPLEAAHDIYNTIVQAGEPFGLQKLGTMVYCCSPHTLAGIAQQPAHFIEAWKDDEGFATWAEENFGIWFSPLASRPTGTYTDDIHDNYRNPFEVGWGKMVNFDHEFKGKAALEAIRDSVHKVIVTLRWNADDIAEVYRSRFGAGPVYKRIEEPCNYDDAGPMGDQSPAMRVEAADGTVVGQSMWHIYAPHYHELVSLAFIEPDYAQQGTELKVIWGEADGPQKAIRATVDRYPYLDLPTNAEYPIEDIPHYQA